MRPNLSRHIAALMLAVTAYFTLGNSLFVHTHVLDNGRIIAHSHPFIPGSHHSHTATALLSLAQLGAEMAAIREDSRTYISRPSHWEKIYAGPGAPSVTPAVISSPLRAPPVFQA